MPSYGFCILATSWLTVVGTITAVMVAPGANGALKRMPNQLPNSVESERARQTRFSGARRRIVFSMRSVDICNLLVAYYQRTGCGATKGLHNAKPAKSGGVKPPSRWVRHDFYQDGALARAVEFTKKNSLPGAESEFAVFDEDGLARSGEDGFHVRVRVAFGVAIPALMRDQAIEDLFDVAGDVGIGVFVDDDSGGGVRNIDVADAVFHIRFADSLFDFAGDIYKLRAAIRFDAKSFHLPWKCYGMGIMKWEPTF